MAREKAEHGNAWVAALAKDAPRRSRKKTSLILNKRLVFYGPLFLCLGVLGVCENLVFPVLSQEGHGTSIKMERRGGRAQWSAPGFGKRVENWRRQILSFRGRNERCSATGAVRTARVTRT